MLVFANFWSEVKVTQGPGEGFEGKARRTHSQKGKGRRWTRTDPPGLNRRAKERNYRMVLQPPERSLGRRGAEGGRVPSDSSGQQTVPTQSNILNAQNTSTTATLLT